MAENPVRSPRFLSVVEEVKQVALTSSTVLLLGETGSGKEVLAQAIHDASAQKDRAMIKVNRAALPASLIESELFGREKGAFTGALARQPGRFEIADGSTIFLDEVGELPFELQPKLLRVLQEGEFERLGGSKTIKVDARVIAATNRPLEQAVREGRFRQDLLYRLDVFPIEVPPLRERIDSGVSEVSELSEIASPRSRRDLADHFIYPTDPSKLPVLCRPRSCVGPLLAT